MDGLTRVRHAIERKPMDRVPRYDAFWEDTLAEWGRGGLPPDADPDVFFDWDIRMMHVDASMRREQKVLQADDDFIVFQDRAGYTVRKMVGKSRALEWLDHATKDKAAWKRLKPGFGFDPNDAARVDAKSYFAHMEAYPTWDEAKRLFDGLRATGKAIAFGVYGPWEATWRHRGYSTLMMDLAMAPAWVCEMAETQVELVIACLRHCIDLDMRPDALFLIDDLASTRALLFSPDMWRGVYKPLYARYGSFLHDNGIWFWLHSCGNCIDLIPDFIDCGLDVLQPLQAAAGLDVRTLKRQYGDDLTLWGNIDVRTLSGTPAECEAEVRDKLTVAKQGGGYMYHSDHSIPPEVSFDRYRWILELIEQYGAY